MVEDEIESIIERLVHLVDVYEYDSELSDKVNQLEKLIKFYQGLLRKHVVSRIKTGIDFKIVDIFKEER